MDKPTKGKPRRRKTAKRHKPRRRKQILRRHEWYKLEALFDNKAMAVCKVEGGDVVLAGWVPPDNEVAICLAPPCITHEQGLALQKLLEANLRAPVVVLTNNIHLAKLRPVTNAEAREIMGDAKGEIVQFTGDEDGEEEGQGQQAGQTQEEEEGSQERAEG